MQTTVKAGAVIVTLLRHERQTPATMIINKLKKHSRAKEIVAHNGAEVRYETNKAGEYVKLYDLRPGQFSDVKPIITGGQIK